MASITTSYDGSLPLAHYLKNYFKQYPILGSRDRRILSGLTYTYYRCAKGIEGTEWFENLASQWTTESKKFAQFSLSEWLGTNNIRINTEKLFPDTPGLSSGITRSEWLASMLVQPNLFIRLRKDAERVLQSLGNAGIPYSSITATCISLPNGAKIDSILPPECYVVQDASSQQTGSYFEPRDNESWYDCCSGAGGKSLLLKDIKPAIQLTVSDRRDSILHNLKERFKLYGHKPPLAYVTNVADAEQLKKTLGKQLFDNIICDAPCSGSGTWARTPEQLHFFDPAKPGEFAALQKNIAANVAGYLKPGGRLIYITCSVFEQENEEVATHITTHTNLQLRTSQLINGIPIGADSMYVAVLQKG